MNGSQILLFHIKISCMTSIIIVTHNSEKEITNCLIHIVSSIENLEIVIIDNKSNDSTYLITKKKFPTVLTKRNNTNYGFAKAANQGAKISKGEMLLFLNPDSLISKNNISKIIEFSKNKKYADIIGFKTLNPNKTLQYSCGNFPTVSNLILDRIPILNKMIATHLIRNDNYYQKLQSPDWVSGACLLVKRSVFEDLDGFDEKYFMYGEDVDFCYRAKKAEYKIIYYPKAEIVHFDEGKFPDKKVFKAIHMRKGFSIFFEKYKPRWYCKIWKFILLIESIFKPYLRQKK